jgi:hypothetical protein
MEAILDVYKRPYDEQHPVICLDEKPYQLIGRTKQPIIKSDGSIIEDYEYKRNGIAQIYMCFEPLGGKRFVEVSNTHNRFDWVRVVSSLLDNQYKNVPMISLVQDNHSSHKPQAFYEVYPPQIARAYLERITFEFTPAHGSWLNMAEFELSVLSRQALGNRVDNKDLLINNICQWQSRRNQFAVKANWQFTKEDARVKLKKLYPSF